MAVQDAPAVPRSDRRADEQGPGHASPLRKASWPSTERVKRLWSIVSIPFWISVSRVVLGLVFADLVLDLLPRSGARLSGAILSGGTWLGAFDRWDSVFYLGIAQHGYPTNPTTLAGYTAFFPGYPLLISLVHGISFGALSYLSASIVVSWCAFVAASILLYVLAQRLYGQRVAIVAAALFCWYPASVFFLAPYSEALFAVEIILVLTLVERDHYLAASLVALYASATSPESLALTAAIVAAALLARRGILRALAYGVISVGGLAVYMLFLWARFHHPFEFVSVQKQWARSEYFPFVSLYRNVLALEHFKPALAPGVPTLANYRAVWILDDAALVLATLLTFGLVAWLTVKWRSGELSGDATLQLPLAAAMSIVTAIIVLIAACTTISPFDGPQYASTEGVARFVGVAMPLYLFAAVFIRRRPALVCFAVGGSVVLALVFQAMYNLGYWLT